MTASEFLEHLKNLPADTPLTATHIAGILEVITPLIADKEKKRVDLDSLSSVQLIDENTLADWIGESVSTIQKWRVKGGIGPAYQKTASGSVRYQVGKVNGWIESNTVSNTAQSTARGLKRFEGLEFDNPVPEILFNDERVEFFASLDREDEPTGYVMIAVENFDQPQNNLPAWLFHQLQGMDLNQVKEQVWEFLALGADLNKVSAILVDGVIEKFTIGHLLARQAFDSSDYSPLIFSLLENDMSVSIEDNHGKTCLDVAFERDNGMFTKVFNTHDLKSRLTKGLATKKHVDGDKV